MRNNIGADSEFPDFEQFVSSFSNNSSSTNETSNNFNNFNSFNSDNNSSNPFGNIDMNTIIRIKQIIDNMNKQKDNPRSNLLLSLKPYLKPSRKQKVDQYIQLFNMSDIIENMKPMGGEKAK